MQLLILDVFQINYIFLITFLRWFWPFSLLISTVLSLPFISHMLSCPFCALFAGCLCFSLKWCRVVNFIQRSWVIQVAGNERRRLVVKSGTNDLQYMCSKGRRQSGNCCWVGDLLNHAWVHYERRKRNPSSPPVLCLNVDLCVCVNEQRVCQFHLNQVSAGWTVNTVSLPLVFHLPPLPDPPLGTSLIRVHPCHVSEPSSPDMCTPLRWRKRGNRGDRKVWVKDWGVGQEETDLRCASWCRAPESWLIPHHLSRRVYTHTHTHISGAVRSSWMRVFLCARMETWRRDSKTDDRRLIAWRLQVSFKTLRLSIRPQPQSTVAEIVQVWFKHTFCIQI